MLAVRKNRICRPDGAEILFWFWFYKYAAPTALGDERRAKIILRWTFGAFGVWQSRSDGR
jgi:hypothetical protein